ESQGRFRNWNFRERCARAARCRIRLTYQKTRPSVWQGPQLGKASTKEPSLSLLFCLRGRFLILLSPGAPQHTGERAVAFVACIFVNRLIRRGPSVLAAPGPVPRVRIFDREAIQQRVGVDAREALHDVEVFR